MRNPMECNKCFPAWDSICPPEDFPTCHTMAVAISTLCSSCLMACSTKILWVCHRLHPQIAVQVSDTDFLTGMSGMSMDPMAANQGMFGGYGMGMNNGM